MSDPAQRSFAGGELAPALQARCDLAKYQIGARTMRNGRVKRTGGYESRNGTVFVAEVTDSTMPGRLIPYVVDGTLAYTLLFGNLYMRVIKNGTQLTEASKPITGVTKAFPAVATIAAHRFENGQELALAGVLGMTQLNGRNFKVTVIDPNTVSLQNMDGTNLDSSAFTAYVSGGTAARVYTIVTQFTTAMLPNLKYAQDIGTGVMTLVCGQLIPASLTTTGDTQWSLNSQSYFPGVGIPTGLTATNSPGTAAAWAITAVLSNTFEESLASAIITSGTFPASGDTVTLGWTAVAGAAFYKVYRYLNGIAGFYSVAAGNSFIDAGVGTPDVSNTPPQGGDIFSDPGNGPSAVAFFQRRQCFGNNVFAKLATSIWCSRNGANQNFTVSSPSQDDDALFFPVPGRHEVRHLLDLKKLVVLTSGGEFVADGDIAGILRPTDININRISSNGASNLAPVVIDTAALYVQARGSIVRVIGFQIQLQGYTGDEVSTFAAHLFDGFTIVDWAYQQTPDPTVWTVRSDGTLLALAFVPGQQILAWSRNDTDGTFENTCVTPEGTEDATYHLVNRTIGGKTKRYIERMPSRLVTQDTLVDYVGMDSALTYDGRNQDPTIKLTISSDCGKWGYKTTMTLESSKPNLFSVSDIGSEFHFTDNNGKPLRFKITDVSADDVAYGKPHKDIPVELQNTATSTWTKAVSVVGGLWHIEGKNVSVFADGFVVASPLNPQYDTPLTVTNGQVTLDNCYGVIHVGLPFICDLETLDIDTPEGDSLAPRHKIVNRVVVFMQDSRSVWVGARKPPDDGPNALKNLTEFKMRESNDQVNESMEDPISLVTDKKELVIQGDWNSNGRVFMRQVDPLPLIILAVVPDVAV